MTPRKTKTPKLRWPEAARKAVDPRDDRSRDERLAGLLKLTKPARVQARPLP